MAARFRIQTNLDGFARFNEMAALWSRISAAEQNNLVLGAKTKARPSVVCKNQLQRQIQYNDPAAGRRAIERLRAIAALWSNLDSHSHAEVLVHARNVAGDRGDAEPLAAVAWKVERLVLCAYNSARQRVLQGEAAREAAAQHGQRWGEYRAEYGAWCSHHVAGEGQIMAYGREIGPPTPPADESADADVDDAAVAL